MKARAAPAPAAPPRSGVKKFFLKISEKMGGIEQTQYSQQFMDSCQEFDNYKLAVEDLVTNLIGIAQQNPKFEPNPMSRMELDYPERENPYELLHPALKDVCALLKNEIEPKKQLDIAAKLGTLHRDFHRRTRRALRNIRYFLSNDFEELTEARNGELIFEMGRKCFREGEGKDFLDSSKQYFDSHRTHTAPVRTF